MFVLLEIPTRRLQEYGLYVNKFTILAGGGQYAIRVLREGSSADQGKGCFLMKKNFYWTLKKNICTYDKVHFSVKQEFSVGKLRYAVLDIQGQWEVLARRPEHTERWRDFKYSNTLCLAGDELDYFIVLDRNSREIKEGLS